MIRSNRIGSWSSFFVGAWSFRKTGIHFSGSCSKRKTQRQTPALRRRGLAFPKLKLASGRLQLSVFVEHRAAIARDAPAMGGERCATAHQVAPRHATGTIAHSRCGRLARRKLGEVDGVGGGCGNSDQNAGGYDRLHAGVHPSCCWKRRAYPVTAGKSSIIVRRTTSRKWLTILI
jgi:hypothetical protein